MSVTAGVSDAVIAVRDKLRGKISQTKVKRYWPGKAPDWADDDDDGNDKDEKDIITTSRASLDQAFGNDGSAGKDDPRLRRLADRRVENRDEARADHRRIRQAEILSTIEEETRKQEGLDAEEDDEDAVEERRRRIKERLRQREIEEAPILEEEEEEEEDEDEGSGSEYETDSEEEFSAAAMVKPIFVPKSERDTVAERERLEAEEAALEEAQRKRVEERKRETKRIVVEEIRKDEEIQRSTEQQEANAGDVDTDDEADEANEYEGWKSREMSRIKRDREERESMAREREEIEKVRNMTEEERREWERKNPKIGSSSSSSSRQKQKWRFMQKYYHKGAFFQAETEAANEARDFSAPTGEDKMDKTILPKVMQVKHFGRSGRTKWTHLVNEDTTDWNNPWTYNDPLRAKYSAKMAGMNAPITKPKGSKKLKDWEQR